MNTNLQKLGRLNPYLVLIAFTIIVSTCGGITFLLDYYSPELLGGILAALLLTTAIILPIHQKRSSFYSVLLVIGAIAFLLSGVIENAYDTIVRPLPVLSKIEFAKVMRPDQISRGLSRLGFGLMYVLISLAGFQSKRLAERENSKLLKFFFWFMLGMGILVTIMAVNSIVEGLSRL